MMLDVLVGALGFFVLAGVYLALAPGDRETGDCAGCSLGEDPTLCGACGHPETRRPARLGTEETDRDRGRRAPGSRHRRNGPREETR